MRRVIQIRNVSDDVHVALAELTGATAILTTDARLANAPGIRCTVKVL